MLDSLRERYREHRWTPVTLGLSGARVWRIEAPEPLYVKTTEHAYHRDTCADLAIEADRLKWLATQGVPGPEVREYGSDEQFAWLVTTGVPGRTGADPWPPEQRGPLVDALADTAVMLHTLPVDTCPYDRRLEVTVPEALALAESGRVDLDDLDAERAGWSAPQLVDALVRTRPGGEDPVVCHGDFCLPNVLFDPETLAFTGVVDVARVGVADRHADVALITRSLSHEINSQFGPAYAARFVDRYAARTGAVISEEKLAYYRLLDEFS